MDYDAIFVVSFLFQDCYGQTKHNQHQNHHHHHHRCVYSTLQGCAPQFFALQFCVVAWRQLMCLRAYGTIVHLQFNSVHKWYGGHPQKHFL